MRRRQSTPFDDENLHNDITFIKDLFLTIEEGTIISNSLMTL